MAVEKLRITTELLDDQDNVVSSESITEEYQEPTADETGSCDLESRIFRTHNWATV